MNLTQDFELAVMEAFDHAMHDAAIEAYRLSGGPFSLAELAAMDHPYATRHASPMLPPEIVNAQTGAFQRDWKRTPTILVNDEVRAQLRNDNRVADYLQYGTRFMVERPIKQEVEKYLEAEINKRIKEKLRAFSQKRYLA